MSKEEKSSLWSGRVQEFRSSGQTCKGWCEEHQIPVSTMRYWIRRLDRKEKAIGDTEPVFAKLPSESEIAMRDTAEGSAAVSIYISGCIRIETASSCPPELFRVLVRTLKE